MLFCLFAVPAAQAMLLELNFSWEVGTPEHPDLLSYNLQEGSIIQVIAFDSTDTTGPGAGTEPYNPAGGNQFQTYGVNSIPSTAQPYSPPTDPQATDPNIPPTPGPVYLADTTQKGHEIVYTGSLQKDGDWYGLYTQIYIDSDVYDTVYVRVFGATSIEQGEVTASYWGISGTTPLSPTFQFQTYELENQNAPNKDYFEVIPEPATLGLLGLGGCALAAWRRRRPQEEKR